MRIKKSFIFVFLIFLGASVNIAGQEYNYYHYDVKDGLSGITVYSIAQDKDGFLWFGTETGLSRFDGNHFKNYTSNEGLNDNEIINLFVDSKNRVWIFPFKNSIYYYYQGKIYNSSNDSLLKKFHLNAEVFKASEDRNGNIFFIEHQKLHILSKSNELIEINNLNTSNLYINSCGISANGNCNFLISSFADAKNPHSYICEYDSSKFYYKKTLQIDNSNRNALEINSNYLVIRNKDFFEIYKQKNYELFKIKVPKHFHTLSYVNDSCFAMSTLDKVFLFNVNQKKIVDSFLTAKTVNKCFEDSEGNLWLGTVTYGTYRLSSTNFRIYSLTNNLTNLSVYALSGFKSDLFIGTSGISMWRLDLQNKELRKIETGTNYVGKISSIQVLNKQDLLLGSDDGIFKIGLAKTSNYFFRTSVKSLFIDSNSLTVATDRSVLNIDLKNFNRIDTIWRYRSTSACKLNEQYYIGTLNGLYVVKDGDKSSLVDLGSIYPVLKDKIAAINLDSSGRLWIGTQNSGLVLRL